MRKALITAFLVLTADQVLKFRIKTGMVLDDSFRVIGDWFHIHFTENNGMAFGLEIEGEYGKLFLSIFRIVAVAGIAWYLASIIRKKAPDGLIISMSLILAGALGNIIDSTFYGLLFTDSYHRVAEFMPADGGYAGLLHGRVVDMFYFPLIEGHFPDWFPFWANEPYVFFRPIFNIADAAITSGVFMIILFQKRYFPAERQEEVKGQKDGMQI